MHQGSARARVAKPRVPQALSRGRVEVIQVGLGRGSGGTSGHTATVLGGLGTPENVVRLELRIVLTYCGVVRTILRRRVMVDVVLTVSAVASALIVGGCSGAGSTGDGSTGGEPPLVVASTTIWADVVSNVSCGEVRVASLIPAGADSHSYELSVRDADELSSASLVVTNGLGLEGAMSDTIRAAADRGVPVLELGPGLRPQGEGDQTDPHVWMDPDRVAEAVPLIAEAVAALGRGPGADDVRGCAEAYVAELRALSDELSTTFEGMDPALANLVTDHTALRYLADRYGLQIVGSVNASTSTLAEANARDLDELAATMARLEIDRVLGEAGEADQAASALGERLDRRLQVVALHTESLGPTGSGADSYISMMRTNGRLIAEQ